jgi:putative membrane protein insertion efficiency factor
MSTTAPGRALSRLPRRLLMGVVQAYRLLLKAWIGNSCRFEPSCSLYALHALDRHGALAGSYLAGARLLRCHPWCHGGLDPVPAAPPGLFTRLGLGAQAGAADGAAPSPHGGPGGPPVPASRPAAPSAEPLSSNPR